VFTGTLGGLSLALVRSGRSSLTAKSLEAFLTHDNMPMVADSLGSTAGEHSPHAAPAVAGAVLMLVLLMVLERLLIVRDPRRRLEIGSPSWVR
jgi:hypothetical protein